MRSVSDGVRLAWRSCLSFSGEAAKKLFACPSAFHTVAHSPTPSPPSCAFASTFPLVSLRGGCVVFDPTTPTDSTARSPSDAGEESRYPPHPPSLFPLSPQLQTSADPPRVSPGNHNTAAYPAFHSLVTTTTPAGTTSPLCYCPRLSPQHTRSITTLASACTHHLHVTRGSSTTSNWPLPLLMPIV